MIRRFLSLILMSAVALAVFTPRVFAQDKDLQFKGGFYERLRHEFLKNTRDMENHYYDGGDRNYFRVKTSLWGQADYKDLLSLYAKLTNETKGYYLLGSGGSKINSNSHSHWPADEVIFDNLYFDLKKPAGIPVNFRIGRQDLAGQYGENFLISDGTPGDGSRTFYFNAVKASWTVDEKNALDLIYINDPRNDSVLPVIERVKPENNLNLTHEEGYVVYLKNKSVKDLAFEPYYIYKREGANWGYAAPSGLQAQKGRINTLGVFAKYLRDPWTFHAQLADQFGKYGLEDRFAQGGYLFVDYDLKNVLWKPQLSAGYLYFSGDNKGTGKNEGWDPLWSRFSSYSELYYQAFQYESGNAYWTNLQMYRLELTVKPTEKAKFNLGDSFLRANDLITANATYNLSGTGKDRGNLVRAKLDYNFNKNVSAYLLGEYFIPSRGNNSFYTKDADPAIFVRTQLELKF